MAKKSSESYRQEKLRLKKKPPMSQDLLRELSTIETMSNAEIDTNDIPERLDWSDAEVGKFYKPIKTQISLRVDTDVLSWFKSRSKQYTSMMNQALRAYITAEEARSGAKKTAVKRT